MHKVEHSYSAGNVYPKREQEMVIIIALHLTQETISFVIIQ